MILDVYKEDQVKGENERASKRDWSGVEEQKNRVRNVGDGGP